MKIKKSLLKEMVKKIYLEEKQVFLNEQKVRNVIKESISTFLKEFDDTNKKDDDNWETDPKNPMNTRLKTTFGSEASIRNILKDPEHPDYQKAKALLDKKKQDPKLQDYVKSKYPNIDVGTLGDKEDPSVDTPPGGPQPTPDSADQGEESETGSVFQKGDEEGESELDMDDEDEFDPQSDPGYIYGDDEEPEISILDVRKAMDLPKYWKALEKYGKEDKIASGKRTSTFVYKTKKRQKGARLTPGGER